MSRRSEVEGREAAGLLRSYAGDLLPRRPNTLREMPADRNKKSQKSVGNISSSSKASSTSRINFPNPAPKSTSRLAAQISPTRSNGDHSGLENYIRPMSATGRLQTGRNPALANYVSGAGSDISYVGDRRHHGILPKADMSGGQNLADTFATAIPEKYHIWEIVDEDTGNGGRQLKRTFPSRIPSSRREVLMLRECHQSMLDDVGDTVENFESSKAVYTSCFNEIIRQVTVHCLERGEFLNDLYNGLVILYEEKFREIMNIAKAKDEEYRKHEEEVNRIRNAYEIEKHSLLKKIENQTYDLRVSHERGGMFAADLETVRLREREDKIFLSNRLNISESYRSALKHVLDNIGETLSMSTSLTAFKNREPSKIDGLSPEQELKETHERYNAQLQSLRDTVAEVNKYRVMIQELETTVSKLQREVDEFRLFVSRPVEFRHTGSQTLPLDIPLPPASTKAIFTEPWAIFFDSFRVGYGKPWGFHQVVKHIDSLFLDKIQNDNLSDAENRPRLNFQNFVHLSFANKYGLNHLAEQHLTDFLDGVHRYCEDNLRVLSFAKFLGFFTPYSLNNLNLYLHCLHLTQTSFVGPTIPEKIVGVTYISFSRAVDTCRILFNDRSPEEISRFIQGVESSSETIPRSGISSKVSSRLALATAANRSGGALNRTKHNESDTSEELVDKILVVSLDKFIGLVLEESERESPATDQYLSRLFSASDIYSDGELDFSEFVGIVRFADPTCSIEQAKNVFREHSEPKTGRLSLVGFLRIGRKYNYAASWMPFLRPANPNESSPNYLKNVLAEQKKSIDTIAHELKMLKSINNHTSMNMFEKLKIREESVRRLIDEKKDPYLAWIAFKMLMNEVIVCRQWRSSLLAS